MAAIQKYKIKLSSGTIIGPLEKGEVLVNLKSGVITGDELASQDNNPSDWLPMMSIPELSEIVIANLEGIEIEISPQRKVEEQNPSEPEHEDKDGLTSIKPDLEAIIENEEQNINQEPVEDSDKTQVQIEEKTVVAQNSKDDQEYSTKENEKTKVDESVNSGENDRTSVIPIEEIQSSIEENKKNRREEETVILSRPKAPKIELEEKLDSSLSKNIFSVKTAKSNKENENEKNDKSFVAVSKKKQRKRLFSRSAFIAIAFLASIYLLFDDDKKVKIVEDVKFKIADVNLKIPVVSDQKEYALSEYQLAEGIKFYKEDTVSGYIKASENFIKAAELNPRNARAFAFLASCYINLIESSEKNEVYLNTISKLLDFALLRDESKKILIDEKQREDALIKGINLPEIVLVDAEFFLVIHRPDAAIRRILDYFKVQEPTDFLRHTLASAYMMIGNTKEAYKQLNAIDLTTTKSTRVFYKAGKLAEQENDLNAARIFYERAIKINPKHAKSVLALALIDVKEKKKKDALKRLYWCVQNSDLLDKKDIATVALHFGQILKEAGDFVHAEQSLEWAVRFDPGNVQSKISLLEIKSETLAKKASTKALANLYKFIILGDKQVSNAEYENAIVSYIKASKEKENESLPYYKLGLLLERMGNYNDAKNNLVKAVTINPNDNKSLFELVRVLINSYDYDNAKMYMEKMKLSEKEQGLFYRLQGELSAHKGKSVEAIIFFKRYINLAEADADGYVELADELAKVSAFRDAGFYYSLARRYDLTRPDISIGLAKIIAAMDGYQKGVAFLEEQIPNSPFKVEYTAGQAEVLLRANDITEAKKYAQKAIAINGLYPESYKILAEAHLVREENDEAIKAYKQYVTRKPGDPAAHMKLTELLLKTSNFREALDVLTTMENLMKITKYPKLHYYKARIFFAAGSVKDAKAEIEKEIQYNPYIVESYILRGMAYLDLAKSDKKEAQGHLVSAMKDFKQAVDVAPSNVQANMKLAEAHALLGNLQTSIAILNRILKIDQGNPDINKSLGLIYDKLGNREKAAKHLRAYIELAPDANDRLQVEARVRELE